MARHKQAKKSQILPSPDLLHPTGVETIDKDLGFYKDLQLDTIVDKITSKLVPKGDSYDDEEAFETIKNRIGSTLESLFTQEDQSIEIANYRSETFQYLQENPDQLEILHKLLHGMVGMHRKTNERYERQLVGIMEQLVSFTELVKYASNLKQDAPETLSRLRNYFSIIGQSVTYKKLTEIATKLANEVDLNIRFRCSSGLMPLKVVSASVVKPTEGSGEFADHIKIDTYNYGHEGYEAIRRLIVRASIGKYERQLANAEAQIDETFKLLPALAFYVGFSNQFTALKKRDFSVCRPKLEDPSYGKTFIKDARHPLITEEPVIPNDIYFDSEGRNRVITGATFAGKTVYVETVGINQAYAQAGLLVFGSEAQISMRDNILTHINTREDVLTGESSHSEEMRRMNDIFREVTPRSLVLLNEPCKGNYHAAAIEQTLDFLSAFEVVGNPTYIATHLHEVAEAVDEGRFRYTKNFHFQFSGDPPNVTYPRILTAGKSPVNYGHIIASKMNLSGQDLLERAIERAKK